MHRSTYLLQISTYRTTDRYRCLPMYSSTDGLAVRWMVHHTPPIHTQEGVWKKKKKSPPITGVRCRTAQYSTAVQHSAVQYNTMLHNMSYIYLVYNTRYTVSPSEKIINPPSTKVNFAQGGRLYVGKTQTPFENPQLTAPVAPSLFSSYVAG